MYIICRSTCGTTYIRSFPSPSPPGKKKKIKGGAGCSAEASHAIKVYQPAHHQCYFSILLNYCHCSKVLNDGALVVQNQKNVSTPISRLLLSTLPVPTLLSLVCTALHEPSRWLTPSTMRQRGKWLSDAFGEYFCTLLVLWPIFFWVVHLLYQHPVVLEC